MSFTKDQIRTVMDIVGIYETGKLGGDYGLVAVLDDGAGISYGRHQTTENSGGLYTLLSQYYRGGQLYGEMAPYIDRLVGAPRGERGSMTQSEEFKDLLRRAGADPLMVEAQDRYFEEKYFQPALDLAVQYEVSNAIGLLQIYDMCIHSGPTGARTHIDRFNDEVFQDPLPSVDADDVTEEQQDLIDKEWTKQLIAFRHNWLANFSSSRAGHMNAVRKTVYRTASTMGLVKEGKWDLARPMRFTLVRDVIGLSNKEFDLP